MASLKNLVAASPVTAAPKKKTPSLADIALAKISNAWKGNSLDAARTAAFDIGMLNAGGMLAYHKADEFWKRRFVTQQVDDKWFSTVHEAFQSGRGSLVTMADLIEQYSPVAANDNHRFQITWFDDVDQTTSKEEIVKGVLGAGEFSLFVAKPGTAKSVLVGDIGCHVAAGLEWHGRKVKQGLVVFFAAERKKLTERRIAAWRKKHGVTNIPFVVVGGKLDLTTGLVDAKALAATITMLEKKSGHRCVLIILDTVTRTFGPGDQHQSRDMSRYVQSVDELNRATDAHVAAIHHSPWSDDRGKGAIDLDGAIDVSFVVNVKGTGPGKTFTLTCTGANDGEEGVITSFQLESMALGTDAEGRTTTAPVVVQVDAVTHDGSNLKGSSTKALEALRQAIVDHGQSPPDGSPGFPDSVVTVTRDQWRQQFYADARAKEPAAAEDTLSRRFRRATSDLLDGKQVFNVAEWFWLDSRT